MRRGRRRARRRRRGWRRLRSGWQVLPTAVRVLVAVGLLVALAIGYQLLRKPTETLAVVPTSAKVPSSTWSAYGALFREYSTEVVSPETLAALVQVETAGDPFARTYWRWRWSWNPLDLYGPASSAVGLLQITDGTLADARHLCIHRHRVVREESLCSTDSYVRWIPSHAVEMTAAWLDQSIREALRGRLARATPGQRQRLAAVIHLCGRQRGAAFARRGFKALPGERCGEHGLAEYLARVDRLADEFGRLAKSDRDVTSPTPADG